MVKLKVPFYTTTKGGFAATVTDIKNIATDQLEGHVELPPLKKGVPPRIERVRWDFQGYCRDHDEQLNLDMTLPKHAEIRQPVSRRTPKTK